MDKNLIVLGVSNAVQDAGIVFIIFYIFKSFTTQDSFLHPLGFVGIVILVAWCALTMLTVRQIFSVNTNSAYRRRLSAGWLAAYFVCIIAVGLLVGFAAGSYFTSMIQ